MTTSGSESASDRTAARSPRSARTWVTPGGNPPGGVLPRLRTATSHPPETACATTLRPSIRDPPKTTARRCPRPVIGMPPGREVLPLDQLNGYDRNGVNDGYVMAGDATAAGRCPLAATRGGPRRWPRPRHAGQVVLARVEGDDGVVLA